MNDFLGLLRQEQHLIVVLKEFEENRTKGIDTEALEDKMKTFQGNLVDLKAGKFQTKYKGYSILLEAEIDKIRYEEIIRNLYRKDEAKLEMDLLIEEMEKKLSEKENNKFDEIWAKVRENENKYESFEENLKELKKGNLKAKNYF